MRKIVVAATGASGSLYFKLLLDKFLQIKDQWQELAVMMSENARTVWDTEIGDNGYEKYPFRFYSKNDFSAPFASGSGQFDTLIVIPCSMGTLGRIAHGLSDDLLTRAADVVLKERRKLICVVRETPFSLIHIRNMELVTLAGGIICPANPSFYAKPATIEQVVQTVVDRVLDLAGFDVKTFRWGNDS